MNFDIFYFIEKNSTVVIFLWIAFKNKILPLRAGLIFPSGSIQKARYGKDCHYDLPAPYVTACDTRADTPSLLRSILAWDPLPQHQPIFMQKIQIDAV